jgi:hypothetical protein
MSQSLWCKQMVGRQYKEDVLGKVVHPWPEQGLSFLTCGSRAVAKFLVPEWGI